MLAAHVGYRVAHNTAISRVIRPRAAAPLVAIENDLNSLAEAVDREQGFDRQRALDRLYALIQRLRPLDRQVMLLYLEEEDAASIAGDHRLSVANVPPRSAGSSRFWSGSFIKVLTMANDHEPRIEQEWRQQPVGRQTMSVEEIRTKAKDFDGAQR